MLLKPPYWYVEFKICSSFVFASNLYYNMRSLPIFSPISKTPISSRFVYVYFIFQTIKAADIATVRKLGKPPYLIMLIMDAVIIYFKRRLEPVSPDFDRKFFLTSWTESLRVITIALSEIRRVLFLKELSSSLDLFLISPLSFEFARRHG